MDYAELSAPRENNSAAISTSTTSAQSATLSASDYVVTVTALTFVKVGANPTAVASTCMALAPNMPYRIKGVKQDEKLAFILPTGTGTAYITPIV